MDFESREDIDGVRITWNNVPKSKLQHQRNVVPLSALYTPLNNKSPIPTYPESVALSCRQCKAYANPFVNVVQQGGLRYQCLFCSFMNTLPQMKDDSWHPALDPQNTTIEYITPRHAQRGPIFMYVVDTCFEGDDVKEAYAGLRDSISDLVALLPSDSLVCFISFGAHVQLHDFLAPHRSIVFNGNKSYLLEEMQQYLHLNGTSNTSNKGLNPLTQRFLNRVDLVEYQLNTIVDLLINNVFPHPDSHRPKRATGCAMRIATLTVQALLGRDVAAGGHIFCFIGGAVTYGPGKVVDVHKKEPIRSHHDIEKSRVAQLPNISSGVAKVNPLLWTEAKVFYSEVASILSSIGISMNLFIGSYDQAGLHEMSVVCGRTGGSVLMCDSFNTTLFKQSFIKFFARKQPADDDPNADEEEEDGSLLMAFNSTLECRTNKDIRIQGLIGHASSIPLQESSVANSMVSPTVIGEGNTNAWKLCSVNLQSTYAIYFDKLDSDGNNATYVQFTFYYQHPNGEYRLRVSTLRLGVIGDQDPQNLLVGFDAQAALAAIARSQIDKLYAPGQSFWTLAFDSKDLNKHLDKMLVDYCSNFAQYTKGDPLSFTIFDQYFELAALIFHLRRSPFIRVFNSSPDETSFYHHVLMHEDVVNIGTMVKPLLLSYDINVFGQLDANGELMTDPISVDLDSSSLGSEKILLLDTFFQILIYHGLTVAAWRKLNYQDQEEYSLFRDFLQAPKIEALYILADRFPLPRFIDCDEGGSQARFLIARLNSSSRYTSNSSFLRPNDILTDDANLAQFMERLTLNIVMGK